jgi:hypothetical protein
MLLNGVMRMEKNYLKGYTKKLNIMTINQINRWKFQNMFNLLINNFQLVKNRATQIKY